MSQYIIAIIIVSLLTAQNRNRDMIFADIIAQRHVKYSYVPLTLTPISTKIYSFEKKQRNGRARVLSLMLRLENLSDETIVSYISQEWFGGLPPSTDLYGAIRTIHDSEDNWQIQPMHLEGEVDSTMPSVVLPKEIKDMEIRLNWPGTGSRPSEPLIKVDKTGSYRIKFLLIYESQGQNCYTVTPEFSIKF